MKIYNEKSNEVYFLEVDVKHLENLHKPHNELPFLPEIKKIDKVKKLVGNLQDKSNYTMHIRNLTQALNYGLV